MLIMLIGPAYLVPVMAMLMGSLDGVLVQRPRSISGRHDLQGSHGKVILLGIIHFTSMSPVNSCRSACSAWVSLVVGQGNLHVIRTVQSWRLRMSLSMLSPLAVVPRGWSTTMSGLQGSMMRRLRCRLNALLHHVRIISTLDSLEYAMIDRLQLLYWNFTWSISCILFFIHITSIPTLLMVDRCYTLNGWLLTRSRTLMLIIWILITACSHYQLINLKGLRLRNPIIIPILASLLLCPYCIYVWLWQEFARTILQLSHF